MFRSLVMIGALAALAGCSNPASPSQAPAASVQTPPRVSGAEAQRLVAAGALLLDVRTPEEFADGHLAGARNIPVDELDGALGQLPRDKPVVVYCAAGGRATVAAGKLAAAGFQVHNLGAMANWNR